MPDSLTCPLACGNLSCTVSSLHRRDGSSGTQKAEPLGPWGGWGSPPVLMPSNSADVGSGCPLDSLESASYYLERNDSID
jgi:hypothetical protein